MPLYFAYGANLDIAAMGVRCPHATPVGVARLVNHRFFIMADGVASVCRHPGAVVHGLLWDLPFSDVAALDAFEDVAGGHYTKIVRPVLRPVGSARAFLYLGHTQDEGLPRPGYIGSIVRAARALALPQRHIRMLERWGQGGTRGASFDNMAGDDAPPGPVAGVRPRFASPYERT